MSLVNARPWMEAMESQLDALKLVRMFLEQAPPALRDLKSWCVDERLLETSTPFAWSDEVTQAVVRAGTSIPLDTPLNRWNLETENVWWHFEKPLPVRTVTDESLGVRAICFGWLRTQVSDFGLPVCAWTDTGPLTYMMGSPSRVSPSQTFEWERGITLGEMLERTRENHIARYGLGGPSEHAEQIGLEEFMRATESIARFILAGLAWLGQSVLVTEHGHVERHRRKEFARRTGREAIIKVVQLRRASYAHTPTNGDGEPINWSCKWVVNGHWRNQACGLKHGNRKLTYILPYVKGPDDKPFRASVPKVYEVTR